nr:tetratricopeptide repeat protein [Bacteroides sp. 519]
MPLCLCVLFFQVVLPTKVKAQETSLTPEEQRKYNYFFLEATKLSESGNPDEAFELYQHALEINPNGASALYEIAQLYLQLNQVQMAQQSLEKAVANDPDNYWYADALANLYMQRGMNAEAIKAMEMMVQRFPNKYETLFGLISLYSSEKDYDKMIGALNKLENKAGKSEQISMEKFRIYLTQEDHKKAFNEIESLVKEYPLDMRYLVILGDVYMQNNKTNEALKAYAKVLENEPGNAMATLALASYYDRTGQTELYDRQIDNLLYNKQIDPDIKLNILRQQIYKAEQAKQDSTEIISLFDRVIEQDQEDTQIPMLYAQYLISKNMEEASIPVLEHILQLDPTNTAARMTLLGSAIRKNDYDQVIRISEPGIELNPESIEFPFYLGISYFQKDEYDKALVTFENALQHLPENVNPEVVSDFYNMIGDIYHTKNKEKEAFAAYDSALVYNPENVGVLNNYAYYISIKKSPTKAELDKADEMSHKTVRKEPTNSTYLDTYAWILFIKGNYAEAKLYIDDALRNDKDISDVIIEHAGDIYYMTGDKEGAMKYWLQAQEIGSESKTLKKKISKKKYIPE